MQATPTALSPIFAMNENALDKLKCLDYEKDYVQGQVRT